MIIDFRIRPPYGAIAEIAVFSPIGTDPVTTPMLDQHGVGWDSRMERSFDRFVEEFDSTQLDRAVVWGRQVGSPPASSGEPFIAGSYPNQVVADIVEENPERFLGFGGIDTSDIGHAVETAHECHELGFHGVAVMNPFAYPPRYENDPDLYPFYQVLSDLGLIMAPTMSALVGPDMTYNDPVHLQRIALDFPELTFTIGHAGWPNTLQMIAVAMQCTNVYLCPDVYLGTPNFPGAQAFVDAANSGLATRLLYGSSYPSRPLAQSLETTAALGWASAEIRDGVLGGNAARLLGL